MSRISIPGAVPDILLIGGVTLLSVILYAGGLGFYSDDWAIIALFRSGPDDSLAAILRIAFDWLRYRPGQAADLGVLYWLFGLQPFGYHLVNAAVLLAGVVMLYLVVRECAQPRVVALAIALLYLLMPHYATARFWFAAFAAGLSMAGYFLSLYADLRVIRPGGRRALAWKALAIVALLASILTYEVFLPLFFLNPLLVWQRSRQRPDRPGLSPPAALGAAVPNLLVLVAVSVYKAMVSTRQVPATLAQHLSWFGALLDKAATNALLGDFGLGLPRFVAGILRDYPDPLVVGGAIVAGAIVFAGLLWAGADPEGGEIRAPAMLALAASGPLVFVGGYAIFLTNFNAAISATGSNNRIGMAAAVGIAITIVGISGGLSTLLPAGRWRQVSFSACIALAAASGFLVINTLARFWVAAAGRQQQVIAGIREDNPVMRPGTVLLLDGVCPYVGPAPVFETSWDLSGALGVAYGDRSLVGDVVTPRLSLAEEGIYTKIYGASVGPHPYDRLLVYDYAGKSAVRMPGLFAAERYFQSWNVRRSGACRSWREGYGESLFVPGEPPIRLGP